MKNFLFTCLYLSILLFSAAAFAQETNKKTATLTVVVTDVKNDNGVIMLALCNSEANYTSEEEPPFEGRTGVIENNESTIIFEDLPIGEYAVKLFHDENANGELDTNILGIPKEGYAFSNNASGSFGPPKYSKAKFDVADDLTIEIRLGSKE